MDEQIRTQADLEQLWRSLMVPLGFTRTSLWVFFLHPDGHPHKALLEIPAPEAFLVPDPSSPQLRQLLEHWTTERVPGGRAAFLCTRPGRGGLTDLDRECAACLYAAARLADVPCEVVHVANDDQLVPVPLDELPSEIPA